MKRIPIEQWGKDHWSTFAYAETLAVDGGRKGLIVPDRQRMRTNKKLHPHLCNTSTLLTSMGSRNYPTRLKDTSIDGHDDWDCLDDAVYAGFLTDEGTGLNRAFLLTDLGIEIASQLRRHKATGGNFGDFIPSFE